VPLFLRPSGATPINLGCDPQAYAMWLLSYAPSGATHINLGGDPQANAMWLLSYAPPGLVCTRVRPYDLYMPC
jgi:hypothetical protein